MKQSADSIEELVLQLEEIEREMSLLEKAIVTAQETGADCSNERTKLCQLHNSQYNETLSKIKNLIANREKSNVEKSNVEKSNVEKSERKICVFARGNIDADHNDVLREYENDAAEA